MRFDDCNVQVANIVPFDRFVGELLEQLEDRHFEPLRQAARVTLSFCRLAEKTSFTTRDSSFIVASLVAQLPLCLSRLGPWSFSLTDPFLLHDGLVAQLLLLSLAMLRCCPVLQVFQPLCLPLSERALSLSRL